MSHRHLLINYLEKLLNDKQQINFCSSNKTVNSYAFINKYFDDSDVASTHLHIGRQRQMARVSVESSGIETIYFVYWSLHMSE